MKSSRRDLHDTLRLLSSKISKQVRQLFLQLTQFVNYYYNCARFAGGAWGGGVGLLRAAPAPQRGLGAGLNRASSAGFQNREKIELNDAPLLEQIFQMCYSLLEIVCGISADVSELFLRRQ